MAYKLSDSSRQRLLQCDKQLQDIVLELIKYLDITILPHGGFRDYHTQQMLFEAGKSKVKYPDSKHNKMPSLAVDMAPYPIDWGEGDTPKWKAYGRFYYMAGQVQMIARHKGINIRWGGDWDGDNDFGDQNFNDLPHFEII